MFGQQQNRIALGARIDRFAWDPCQTAKTDCYGLKDYLIALFTAWSHRQRRVGVSSYYYAIQSNAALTFLTAILHTTDIHYWKRHQRCTLVKSRTGLHLHSRFTYSGLHFTWTFVTQKYLSNFFAGQLQSPMTTFGKNKELRLIHTLWPSQMVFVNKTSKDNWIIYWHYGHLIVRCHATISANFVCRECYSIMATLSLDGYKAMHVVSVFVNGEKFLNYITNDVVCFMFYLFKTRAS